MQHHLPIRPRPVAFENQRTPTLLIRTRPLPAAFENQFTATQRPSPSSPFLQAWRVSCLSSHLWHNSSFHSLCCYFPTLPVIKCPPIFTCQEAMLSSKRFSVIQYWGVYLSHQRLVLTTLCPGCPWTSISPRKRAPGERAFMAILTVALISNLVQTCVPSDNSYLFVDWLPECKVPFLGTSELTMEGQCTVHCWAAILIPSSEIRLIRSLWAGLSRVPSDKWGTEDRGGRENKQNTAEASLLGCSGDLRNMIYMVRCMTGKHTVTRKLL